MPREEGIHDSLSSTGSHVGGEGAPRRDGPGVRVRSGLLRMGSLVEGGSFTLGPGSPRLQGSRLVDAAESGVGALNRWCFPLRSWWVSLEGGPRPLNSLL